ncbi:hypothetical protein BDF20DRAFT_840480 [Mycotypha africana]|uniref:uncharacterized protein n=1 Tax=Mycotypha africana TaxID=64632 RepID=UPI002301E6EA|nr:uncharacterized protein BDF20DRAFT_840480 [Mycotypha africana]KAI8967083.1 hypothetical protein BDF20DRAFT_840480 [Mycotypha africana]
MNAPRKENAELDMATRLKLKAKLLANFQRALASTNMDLIWPIYDELYDYGFLQCVSRRVFHYLIKYTINSRATSKNLNRFKTIVEDMLTHGHHLTVSEYNALIHWVGGHTVPQRRPQHFTEAMKIFDEMQQPYVILNVQHQSSLGTGIERKIAKEPVGPNAGTFNTLINIAAQISDVKAAQKLYHDMVSRGIPPDTLTYSTLIKALGKIGDVDGIDYLLQRITDQHDEDLIRTTYIWNTIIAGYAFNGLPERAYELFHKMKEVNRVQLSLRGQQNQRHPNKGKRKRGQQQQQQQRCSKKKGIPKADFETFRIYIDLLLQDGKREEAVSTLFTMQPHFNVKPTVKIYNSLFKSFMQNEALVSSEDDIDDCDKRSFVIDKQYQLDLEKVHQIYQHMVKNQVKPNSETLYTLVSALLDLGDTQNALTLFMNITKKQEEQQTSNDNVDATSVKILTSQIIRLQEQKSQPSSLRINPLLFARIRRLTSSSR